MSDRHRRDRHRQRSRRPGTGRGGSWRARSVDIGTGVVMPAIDDVLAAVERVPAADDWERIRPGLMPIFERFRPLPADVPAPLTAVLPPGVSIGIAYDFGPGFLRISRELAERWPASTDEIVALALANLRRRVRDGLDRRDLVRHSIDGLSVVAYQSRDGWASMLLLLSDLLEELFGSGPLLFIAPMRDLLIALPPDVDPEFATRLAEEFEAADPNALRLEGFHWASGRLSCRPLLRQVASA